MTEQTLQEKIENIAGKIYSITQVNQPGFRFNSDYVDVLTRFGFKPTQAVYEVDIDLQPTHKFCFQTIDELFLLAQKYNCEHPSDLVGRDVNCTISGNSISAGFITRLEAKV